MMLLPDDVLADIQANLCTCDYTWGTDDQGYMIAVRRTNPRCRRRDHGDGT